MRTPASRILLILAPAALVAAVTTGCDANLTSATPAATSSGSAPATAASTTKASKPSASKSTGARKAAGLAACRMDDVESTVIAQSDRTRGTIRMAILQITNVSQRACRVDGWAAVSLVNLADEVVSVPTTNVPEPGDATPIDLAPGTSASAGLKWTACDKSDDSCHAGNTLRVNLSASTDGPVAKLDGFPAPERGDITMKQLKIGSLQPSNQGVVAW